MLTQMVRFRCDAGTVAPIEALQRHLELDSWAAVVRAAIGALARRELGAADPGRQPRPARKPAKANAPARDTAAQPAAPSDAAPAPSPAAPVQAQTPDAQPKEPPQPGAAGAGRAAIIGAAGGTVAGGMVYR